MEYTKELHEALINDPTTKDHDFTWGEVVPALLAEITRLQSLTQWVPGNVNPELTDGLPGEYCDNYWTGNDYEVFQCRFWCEIEFQDTVLFDCAKFNFESEKWTVYDGISPVEGATVKRWTHLPLPPEGVK